MVELDKNIAALQQEFSADDVLTCEQLKTKCKEYGIKIGKGSTKESLIQLLKDYYILHKTAGPVVVLSCRQDINNY